MEDGCSAVRAARGTGMLMRSQVGGGLEEHWSTPQPSRKGTLVPLDTLSSVSGSLPIPSCQLQCHTYSCMAILASGMETSIKSNCFPLICPLSPQRVTKCHLFMNFSFFPLKYSTFGRQVAHGLCEAPAHLVLPSQVGAQHALPEMQLCPLSMDKVIFSMLPAKIA